MLDDEADGPWEWTMERIAFIIGPDHFLHVGLERAPCRPAAEGWSPLSYMSHESEYVQRSPALEEAICPMDMMEYSTPGKRVRLYLPRKRMFQRLERLYIDRFPYSP